jgi:hypothetical protein
VQEGLTNARKHAPGAEVVVRLAGSPGEGLTVEVCNEAPDSRPPGALHPDPPYPDPPHPDPPHPDPPHPDLPHSDPPHPDAGYLDPPVSGPPVGERSPMASSGPGVVHSPLLAVAHGQGLAGLAERVALADGRLEHGPTAGGGWRLAAWLPWPP